MTLRGRAYSSDGKLNQSQDSFIATFIASLKTIHYPKLQALSYFTKEMFVTRGRPSAKAVDAFIKTEYNERKILEIILALAVKPLSNYSNHVFDTNVDDIFKDTKWSKPDN